MPDLPEHEERSVRQYVNTQSEGDNQATFVQKVGSRRILGRVHELYDVHSEKTRWWVISNPMNLYLQEDFPDLDMAFTFHLGFALRIIHRSRTDPEDEPGGRRSETYRHFRQAGEAMDSASEAADFQAIGIRCRETLLALVRELADEPWVDPPTTAPKQADVKNWGAIFAQRLAVGRLRKYVKDQVHGVWDLALWLQHDTKASPVEAEFVLNATGHLLELLVMLIRRLEEGPPQQCPRCGSYALDEDMEMVEEPESGYSQSTVCRACEWRSEGSFTSWGNHFEGADIEGYLNQSTGLSDRFPRNDESAT